MIRDTLLPTKIGSFYLFSQRVVSVEITQSTVKAISVLMRGRARIFEGAFHENIDLSIADYQVSAAQALHKLLQRIGLNAKIVFVIPSTAVVYKMISLPALTEQKQKLLVPFELAPLLPFSLEQASFDSLMIGPDIRQQRAEVMVAVAKSEFLHFYTSLLRDYKAVMTKFTSDLVELYNVYLFGMEYSSDPTAIIDVGSEFTRLLVVRGKHIVGMRIITKKLPFLDDNSGEMHGQHVYLRDEINSLLDEIKFTLENIMSGEEMVPEDTSLKRIILTGTLVAFSAVQQHIEEKFQISCQLFTVKRLLNVCKVKQQHECSEDFMILAGAALLDDRTEDFNIDQRSAIDRSLWIITKQVIWAISLIVLLLSALLVNRFLMVRSLQRDITYAENEAVQLLMKKLDLPMPRGKSKASLEQLNALARSEVERKENIWFALSSKNRFSFLAYLQELSVRIKRDEFGLNLRQLNIDGDIMTLEGNVKNFEALRMLEESLSQSKLFKSVSKPQDLKFNVKIVLEKKYSGD